MKTIWYSLIVLMRNLYKTNRKKGWKDAYQNAATIVIILISISLIYFIDLVLPFGLRSKWGYSKLTLGPLVSGIALVIGFIKLTFFPSKLNQTLKFKKIKEATIRFSQTPKLLSYLIIILSFVGFFSVIVLQL